MKVFSLFFLLFVCVISAQAQLTLTVTRSDDRNTTCVSGIDCSLREAINAANAAPTNDTINFSPSVTTITLTSEIVINNAGTLAITGNGANVLTISGGGTNRIFYTNQATVTISGVKLTGGNGTGASVSGGNGGAIYANGGSLTLDSVHVTSNSAETSFAEGGGVFVAVGTHLIVNSTFSANTADDCGGGFYNLGGTLTVVNSTISGNTATGINSAGGGFCNANDGTTILRNVTITNNTASVGGGIFIIGTLNFGNTIVACNTANKNNVPRDIYYSSVLITSAGNNLVGSAAGRSANTNRAITYQPTDIRDVDPKLGALTIANGGQTPTHALLAGSPAIDTGNNALAVDPSNGNAALDFDQRGAGFPRIVDGDGNGTATVDIGAFEVQLAPTAASVSVSGRVTDSRSRGIANALVRLTKQNGEVQTTRTTSFGYYTFTELAAGETYIFEVSAKRYQFQPQVLTITEDLTALNFTAEQQSGKARQTIW